MLKVPFPSRMVLLRADNNNYVGFRRRGQTFIVGLPNKELVKKCSQHISISSKILMKEVAFTNVKNDMIEVLPEFHEMSCDKVMMDTDVKLLIEKKEPEPFFYQSIDSDEFMMYPFTKNIGVLFVDQLVRETKTHLVLNAHVIAPTFSTDLFEL